MGLDNFETEQGRKNVPGVNQYNSERWTKERLKDEVKKLNKETDGIVTVRDVDQCEDLPSLGTLYKLIDSWSEFLDKLSIESNTKQEYTEDDKEDMLDDLKKCYAETDGHLTVRKYMNIGSYSHSAIKKMFSSWNQGIEKAGLDTANRHGNTVECKCGRTLDSAKEKVVGDILHELRVEHRVHKKIPNSPFLTDFYLPTPDIWVEVDGYTDDSRPNKERYKDKKQKYEELDLTYVNIQIPYRVEEQEVKEQIAQLTS